jgi:hypothetical protein
MIVLPDDRPAVANNPLRSRQPLREWSSGGSGLPDRESFSGLPARPPQHSAREWSAGLGVMLRPRSPVRRPRCCGFQQGCPVLRRVSDGKRGPSALRQGKTAWPAVICGNRPAVIATDAFLDTPWVACYNSTSLMAPSGRMSSARDRLPVLPDLKVFEARAADTLERCGPWRGPLLDPRPWTGAAPGTTSLDRVARARGALADVVCGVRPSV